MFTPAACSADAQSARSRLTHSGVISRSVTIAPAVYRLPHDDETGKTAAITVRGNDLDVDFAGATLEGTAQTTEPDKRVGTGIRVEGRNVTIRNAKVRGYKIGLIAYDCPGLKLVNCDLSYNWKQRLASTLDREDGSDWMSYHQNEKDEWLRYGAGVYLRRCNGFVAKGVTVRGGQCGLMLTECSKGLVWNCDLSFLSAIGLGMYRSSDNRIMHNRIDWCVRGYSHGRWNRGQDSAGILIYEQSNRNVFAYNSVTHGGDGFFLWAGQTTMDTGEGGCNDNLLYGNDFSHAPTNGIEATFSRNRFVNNLVMECWHGVWGGYSYDTQILGNIFAYNAESIAIEHGQNNTIRGNAFYREAAAIHVWQNETQDPNWGYPKHHDTKSHGYDVRDNVFSQITQGRSGRDNGRNEGLVLRLKATSDFHLGSNRYGPVGGVYDVRGPFTNFRSSGGSISVSRSTTRPDGEGVRTDRSETTASWGPNYLERLGNGFSAAQEGHVYVGSAVDPDLPPVMQTSGNVILPYPEGREGYRRRFVTNWNPLKPSGKAINIGVNPAGQALIKPYVAEKPTQTPRPLPEGIDPFLKPGDYRGRAYILVDGWGPYDFQSPLLWPRAGSNDGKVDTDTVEFEVLGPRGGWRAKRVQGGSLSAMSGAVPGFVTFKRARNGTGRVVIELEYVGGRTVDYRGIGTPAGTPVPFRYSEFSIPIDWSVRFFRYDKATQEPRTMGEAFNRLIAGAPIAEMKATSLDLIPGGIPRAVPGDYFATVAEGAFEIEPGDYTLDITTDDGARLYLDGKLLVDEWHYQGPTLYSRDVHLAGKHTLRVEHFQIDGYWTLKVNIRPKQP